MLELSLKYIFTYMRPLLESFPLAKEVPLTLVGSAHLSLLNGTNFHVARVHTATGLVVSKPPMPIGNH